jgi:exodeoxyribonuclease VII large subunit
MSGLFDNDDPFGLPPLEHDKGRNAPAELTVSELSQKLKMMVEDTFGFVRVRGEISKVTVAKSGHLYTALKDADAVLDAVCWKGTVARLGLKPEEGMDVVCTGRLTTYPGRSNYQLIIETMELAGQGALLKMLEERKKKLLSEGLFDASRKRAIPYLPRVIGVITSPTGAVIRDILHRLNERFPRHVLIWPVQVQGANAAKEVTAAIEGFNKIPLGSPNRPDVLIVARGGGSLEDLMPFNDETLVRAAAHSKIPLISAVGHETDTTLIDFAADLRAPTPTAAAEKAVPVRTELILRTQEQKQRLLKSAQRLLQQRKDFLSALARALPRPEKIFEILRQKFDHIGTRLDGGLKTWLDRRRVLLAKLSGKISPQNLRLRHKSMAAQLKTAQERLNALPPRLLDQRRNKLSAATQMLNSLSFERVLERGFAVVFDDKGNIVTSAKVAEKSDALSVKFKDGDVKVKKA